MAPKKQASQASWRGPKNYQRSDERIKEDVCERLTREHAVDTSDVSVDVHDAIVVLEGIVPARPMKHAIENIASVCVGVRDVENRLRITRDTSSTLTQLAGTTMTLYALRGGVVGLLIGAAGELILLRTTTNKPFRRLAGMSAHRAMDAEGLKNTLETSETPRDTTQRDTGASVSA